MAQDSTWVDMPISWDDTTRNVLDISGIVLEHPAGKHGFVKRVGDKLVFEDGTPARFFGTNLVQRACLTSHASQAKMIASLADKGQNILRIHMMDMFAPNGLLNSTTNELDPVQMEKFDHLIYQAKQRGIYVELGIHAGRNFTAAEGAQDVGNLLKYGKPSNFFDPVLIQLQKKYIISLLNHVNQYTNVAYKNEPAIAFIECTNENSMGETPGLSQTWGEMPASSYYMGVQNKLLNSWLKNKYRNTDALKTAWNASALPAVSNLFRDSDFSAPIAGIWGTSVSGGAAATFTIDDSVQFNNKNTIRCDISTAAANLYNVELNQLSFPIMTGRYYTISFRAKASAPLQAMSQLILPVSPYTHYGYQQTYNITTSEQLFTYTFLPSMDSSSSPSNCKFALQFGKTAVSVWFGDFSLTAGAVNGLNDNESIEAKNVQSILFSNRYNYSNARCADMTAFITDVESKYYREMVDAVRSTGCRALIKGSNQYFGNWDTYAQARAVDVMDIHAYHELQAWVNPNNPHTVANASNTNTSLMTLNSNNNTTFQIAKIISMYAYGVECVKDMPVIVSEWDMCFPNQYWYEAFPYLVAYGLFQGYNALMSFEYWESQSGSDAPNDGYVKSINNEWNSAPPKCLAHTICSLAFIRGDFKRSTNPIEIAYNISDVMNQYKQYRAGLDYCMNPKLPSLTHVMHGVRKSFGSSRTSRSVTVNDVLTSAEQTTLSTGTVITSDTGELTWHKETVGAEYFTADSPKSQWASGFLANVAITMNNFSFTVAQNCSVMLTSLKEDIANSKRMILVLLSQFENTGEVKNGSNTLTTVGAAPVICEPVEGTFSISMNQVPANLKIFALNANGSRRHKIPYTVTGNTVTFTLNHAHKSMAVEITSIETQESVMTWRNKRKR